MTRRFLPMIAGGKTGTLGRMKIQATPPTAAIAKSLRKATMTPRSRGVLRGVLDAARETDPRPSQDAGFDTAQLEPPQ